MMHLPMDDGIRSGFLGDIGLARRAEGWISEEVQRICCFIVFQVHRKRVNPSYVDMCNRAQHISIELRRFDGGDAIECQLFLWIFAEAGVFGRHQQAEAHQKLIQPPLGVLGVLLESQEGLALVPIQVICDGEFFGRRCPKRGLV